MEKYFTIFVIFACFGAGFMANEWRHSLTKINLDQCQDNTSALSGAIDIQNESIVKSGQEAEKVFKRSSKAVEAAQERKAESDTKTKKILETQGSTCEDAEKLINEAFGL